MAGSIKWFVYQDDNGDPFAVKMDKGNAIAGGFVDVQPNALTTIRELPRGFTMRYVNVMHLASGAKRRLYLGQRNNPLQQGGTVQLPLYVGNTSTAQPFFVTSYRGEKKRRVFGEDTALKDS